jgi:hypothetical protein
MSDFPVSNYAPANGFTRTEKQKVTPVIADSEGSRIDWADWKGTLKLTVKDGMLSKMEIHLAGTRLQ